METKRIRSFVINFRTFVYTRATFLVAILVFLIHKVSLGILIKYNVLEAFGENGNKELITRLSVYDGNIYARISELGYNYWYLFSTRPIEFSFLPGWPWLLRFLFSIASKFTDLVTIESLGIITNQILLFPMIYLLLKLCQKLQYSIRNSALISVLFLYYPGSVFFNFNYNETLFLVGLLLFSNLWVSGRRSLALAVVIPFTLVRLNIIFIVLGVVLFELGKHFQLNNLNLAIQNFDYHAKMARIWLFSKRKWIIFWLIILTLPLFFWFLWQYQNYGEIMYFSTQKLYFNRQSQGLQGVYYAILDSLQILQNKDLNLFSPKNLGLFSLPFLLGSALLTAFFGIQRFFEKSSKVWKVASVAILTFWSLVFIYKNSIYWNSPLVADVFINILPMYVIFCGIYGMFKNSKLRFWLIATLLCLYLPLSSGTFASMNRYIIQSPILFVAFYDSNFLKNKAFYFFTLIIFLAGYALLFYRFTHYEWAG